MYVLVYANTHTTLPCRDTWQKPTVATRRHEKIYLHMQQRLVTWRYPDRNKQRHRIPARRHQQDTSKSP